MKCVKNGKKYIVYLSEDEVNTISASLDSCAEAQSYSEDNRCTAYNDVGPFLEVWGSSIYKAIQREGKLGK